MGVNIKIELAYQFGEFLSSAHEGEELNDPKLWKMKF